MWTESAPVEKLAELSLEELEHIKKEVHDLICIYDYNPMDNTIFISLNKIWSHVNDEIKRRTEPTTGRMKMTFKSKEEYKSDTEPKIKIRKPRIITKKRG